MKIVRMDAILRMEEGICMEAFLAIAGFLYIAALGYLFIRHVGRFFDEGRILPYPDEPQKEKTQ